MPSSSHFPLRWESTGDQWWYASPIDWAAANGHYDLVRELLRIDANHLIKLTSLPRIRRLETVWDDEHQFQDDVAKCRSEVAKKLLVECETKKGNSSLIGAGYGGWLLYTAASAGDLGFVRELLDRDPLLVFGEGEYGVTDILYAAARSKDPEVFKVVLDFAASPRFSTTDLQQSGGWEVPIPSSCYKLEIMNRALHAAARGGNMTLLKELLATCSDDALSAAYRDSQGATVLHAAAARGQLEVVKYLTSSYSGIINSTDNQGNSALHVAAHRGHLPIVEALILASPSSIYAANNAGETFLHAAVAGFQTPGFQRLDRQIELLKHLTRGRLFDIKEIINIENNEGRTVLHLAIMGNVHSNLLELLMTIRGINVNIRDADGMTPLGVLRRREHSASSELLTRQLISAGGIFFSSRDYSATRVIPSHKKRQSIGSSPGTSFRISDIEIFLYTGMEKNLSDDAPTMGLVNTYSPEVSRSHDSNVVNHSSLPRKTNKMGSINYALSQRLKGLLHWPKMKKERASERLKKLADQTCANASKRVPVPLRQRYSNPSSLPNNKRALSVRSQAPNPAAKKKLASGVMHEVMQAVPSFTSPHRSRSSSFSTLSLSPQSSSDPRKGASSCSKGNEIAKGASSCSKDTAISDGGAKNSIHRRCDGAVNKKLMNQYLCFGSPAQRVEAPTTGDQQAPPYDIYVRSILSVA